MDIYCLVLVSPAVLTAHVVLWVGTRHEEATLELANTAATTRGNIVPRNASGENRKKYRIVVHVQLCRFKAAMVYT